MVDNPYWNSKPDLTRLPEHLRQTLTQPVPMRPAEIRARTIIFPLINEQGLQHPNGRIRALPYIPDAARSNEFQGIQLECSNFTGHKPIYVTILGTEDVPEFLKGLITSYLRNAKSWEVFDKLVEELKCQSPQLK